MSTADESSSEISSKGESTAEAVADNAIATEDASAATPAETYTDPACGRQHYRMGGDFKVLQHIWVVQYIDRLLLLKFMYVWYSLIIFQPFINNFFYFSTLK